MPAIGNQQIRHQLRLFLFRQGINNRIKILHRDPRDGLIARMLRQPSKMLVKQLADFPFKEVNQVHLANHHHALRIAVQASDQVIVLAVIDIQPLITGNDTHIG